MTRFALPLALASGLFLAACGSSQPTGASPGGVLSSGIAPAASGASSVDEPRPLVVMNLAAHPDDEDGLMLAYARGNRNAVTYSVIYTRGEGGQNEAGPELYERLGAIRSGETEAAARVLGTQVYFLNHYDFGFSKHADEAFAEWGVARRSFWEKRPEGLDVEAGRDSVTARIVYLYRKLKPDVVFTNHDTVTVGDDRQHGHHQAVGISGYDAFTLAADPSYHPEQLAEPGVDLWQPKRFFLRRGGFSDGAPEAFDVAAPVGDACAATAYRDEESCAARAVAGASLHVSQGFDKFAPRFYRETTYYQLLRSASGVPALAPGATDLAEGLADRSPAPHTRLRYLIDSGRVPQVSGFEVSDSVVVAGQTFTVLSKDGGSSLAFAYPDSESSVSFLDIEPDKEGTQLVLPARARATIPAYRAMYESYQTPRQVIALASDSTGIVGASYLPIEVAPPVMAELPSEPVALSAGENSVPVTITTYDPTATQVTLDARVWWDGRIRLPMSTAASGDDQTVPASTPEAMLDLPMENQPPGRYELALIAQTDSTLAIPFPFVDAMPAAILPDVSVARGLKVGFVRSYDGTMAEALVRMGAEVTDLDSLDLARGDFDGLHTIVIDIRAYLDRRDLRAHNEKLLAWVREGGHLVVGYQKLFEWNAGRPHPLWEDDSNPPEGFAPYPLQLGRERITMENVPVTVSMPDHALFTTPHAITVQDWDGWVQERGLYFPTDDADARYLRPLAMADRGEDPLTTGLLLADVGDGTYLYSPLVWYRQLAALNPGAWRMFANLVSLPLTDGR